jgi:hypothetical protein
VVFSRKGAFLLSLNVALPVAASCMLLMSASSTGWAPKKRRSSRLRWLTLLLVFAFGVALFAWLPKVEVEIVRRAWAVDG